jgi:hypothetical protein
MRYCEKSWLADDGGVHFKLKAPHLHVDSFALNTEDEDDDEDEEGHRVISYSYSFSSSSSITALFKLANSVIFGTLDDDFGNKKPEGLPLPVFFSLFLGL